MSLQQDFSLWNNLDILFTAIDDHLYIAIWKIHLLKLNHPFILCIIVGEMKISAL